MGDPPSPQGVTVGATAVVIVDDAQDEIPVDAPRWAHLAEAVLASHEMAGELTLTFVDRDEITALKVEHFGDPGEHPTDVLAFPLDVGCPEPVGPTLLGDVVVCPSVAAEQFADHAGTLHDELALLIVHGVLHVIGFDHDDDTATEEMRAVERELLERHHWGGPAPAGFRQGHGDEGGGPRTEGRR